MPRVGRPAEAGDPYRRGEHSMAGVLAGCLKGWRGGGRVGGEGEWGSEVRARRGVAWRGAGGGVEATRDGWMYGARGERRAFWRTMERRGADAYAALVEALNLLLGVVDVAR